MRSRPQSTLRVFAAIAAAVAVMAAPARLYAETYYVSASAGNDRYDGLAARQSGAHGPWRSLTRASAVTYRPGDRLLLQCGGIWDEMLTLRGDGTPEHPVTVSSYGSGERPYIRRTLGKNQACILIDDACGYRIRDLEIGRAESGIHVRLGSRRPDYPFLHIEGCFFHDITNPKCPDEGEPWGWAIWWDGPGHARDIRVTGCLGLRTQAFFKGQSNKTGVVFCGNTISHGSYNQVFQSEVTGMDITNCVFVYNYPWRYFRWGITQVIAGNLPGGPGVRYDVRNNEFGWPGDYPGAPDGCGYDFEVSSNGVTFQNNFVHNSYGEAVLFMGGMRQQNMLFADNVFRDNARFGPRWDCTIALFPNMSGNGTFRNNTFYLWPGKKAFASKPSCFTYENNDEHPTRPFAAMPLVTRIGKAGGARTYALACATPGATIRYTTDASLPNETSTVYTRPIVVRRSGVVNAKAFKKGFWPSYVNSLAVEMRTPEGLPPIATWRQGTGSMKQDRLATVADNFTVSFWAKPTGPRKATPEMGAGSGLTGVDWWKMDEGSGSTLADTVGGNPGALTGCTWTRDASGPALRFNGTSDSVAFGGFGSAGRESIADNFTIAFWTEPEAERASTPEVSTGVSTMGGQQFALMPTQHSAASGDAGAGVSVGTNGVSVFELADNYLPSLLVADRPLAGWHHIVLVYRDRQPSLYIDGALVKTGLKSARHARPDFSLGGNVYGRYKGKLRDLRVYPRSLTEAEVRAVAGGKVRAVPWTLDKTAGTQGLPFALAPVLRGGRDTGHAGMGVSIGTNGISVCESSDDYLPSVLISNRPIAGWNHVAVVYRDKQPHLYLNGVYEKAGCRSEKVVHPVFDLRRRGYTGGLDSIKVYDRPLTDAEVQQLAARR